VRVEYTRGTVREWRSEQEGGWLLCEVRACQCAPPQASVHYSYWEESTITLDFVQTYCRIPANIQSARQFEFTQSQTGWFMSLMSLMKLKKY
jgi:hypothetical protein